MLANIDANATFKDNLAKLPPVDGIVRIEMMDGNGQLVASIENQPGKQGSLAVYQYLGQHFGSLDGAAARHGLDVFAEHTADARQRPGAHPNIDRLLQIVDGSPSLTMHVISVASAEAK